MELVIKAMETDSEICGKAYVHWKAWHETYRGMIDDAYLDALTYEKCEALAYRWRRNTLVAMDGEKVVGFAAYDRRDETTGEVFALYVLGAYQGKGIGYALMNRCIEALFGCETVYVRALKANEKAIAFYERYGFVRDGFEEQITLGTPVTEIRLALRR